MSFWIWITILLITFIDRIVHGAKRVRLEQQIAHYNVKKLIDVNDIEQYELISSKSVMAGDFILLEVGDVAPCDGIIIKGTSYVNQTSITGELDAIIKCPTSPDNRVIEGSIIESDWLIVKITLAERRSLITQISKLLGVIERELAPSEIALQRVILGLAFYL
jgi:P-type E1-E2 ATPase